MTAPKLLRRNCSDREISKIVEELRPESHYLRAHILAQVREIYGYENKSGGGSKKTYALCLGPPSRVLDRRCTPPGHARRSHGLRYHRELWSGYTRQLAHRQAGLGRLPGSSVPGGSTYTVSTNLSTPVRRGMTAQVTSRSTAAQHLRALARPRRGGVSVTQRLSAPGGAR